ncbi:SAM-dependent methyltransferase [Sphaerisporangium corydalis]|uniref:SAM-dependent methyltransferase n=1 Tax=Sphaerisporangium corydalis TaxID=1441875 RepID=A0ABV9EV02_9ACTN|nr:SAM-dependent methyltransferase [Sphaerisporangium corydalis]
MEALGRDPSQGSTSDPPEPFDTNTPSVARMYDYFLGGKDNFAIDRERAEEVIRSAPHVPLMARANRAFLGRAVRFLAGERGIRQFLDIGTGLPTQENVHQVAQGIDPRARVVYVDNDPIVLGHASALLTGNPNTHVMAGDLRRPWKIVSDPHVRGVLDFAQPMAVLLCAVLHFIGDEDDPYELVSRLVGAMCPGSYLVVSHAENHRELSEVAGSYEGASASVVLRSWVEIAGFFDGLELVSPGVVYLPLWRPDGPVFFEDNRVRAYGGIGRKR